MNQTIETIWLHNATLWTGENDSPIERGSLLFRGTRVLASGTEGQVAAHPLAGKAVRRNLQGATLLPGMTDGHTHVTGVALKNLDLDLRNCRSFLDLRRRLEGAAGGHAEDRWIHGARFDETRWEGSHLPTRTDLDQMGIGIPVLLTRCNGSLQAANTIAQRKAHVTGDPETPLGEEDARRILQAHKAYQECTPLKQRVLEACRQYLRFGITEVHTCNAPTHGLEDSLGLFQELHREDALPLRVVFYAETPAPWNMQSGFGDAWLRYGGFKYFLDGNLGGRTAWMSQAYADAPGNFGAPNHDPASFVEEVKGFHRRGVQLFIHAIGDAALDLAILALKEAEKLCPHPCGLPHRINHIMVCRDDQIQTLRKLHVTLEIQPSFVPSDLWMVDSRLGERARLSYRWKDLVDAGLCVNASSDGPVESISSFQTLWAALTRTERDDTSQGGWFPNQRLSLPAALRLLTVNPARAVGEGKQRGKLLPGYQADFSILNANLFALHPEEIASLEVQETYVNGHLEYQAG